MYLKNKYLYNVHPLYKYYKYFIQNKGTYFIIQK